jgi:hypothetical protein
MVKSVLVSFVLLFSFVSASIAADAGREAQERARAGYERASQLRARIAVGWTEDDVAAIMGDPEAISRQTEGADLVETWWYQGYEIAVEFRNGAASNWFFRFMKSSPPGRRRPPSPE